MPTIIAQRSAIKKLQADTRENGFGNYVLSLFEWKRLTRAAAVRKVSRQFGLTVDSNKLYISEDIPVDEFKISHLATLTTEFQASGDYFEVLGIDAYIQLTPAEYAQEVPVEVPHREDSEGNVLLWSEWKKPRNSHVEFEGNHYIPCHSQGPLALSKLITLNETFTVKPFKSFPSIDSEV